MGEPADSSDVHDIFLTNQATITNRDRRGIQAAHRRDYTCQA
jgi:hypothetical protein